MKHMELESQDVIFVLSATSETESVCGPWWTAWERNLQRMQPFPVSVVSSSPVRTPGPQIQVPQVGHCFSVYIY